MADDFAKIELLVGWELLAWIGWGRVVGMTCAGGELLLAWSGNEVAWAGRGPSRLRDIELFN